MPISIEKTRKKLLDEARGFWNEFRLFGELALKALRFWHREPPVLTVADLVRFAETRAKYVTQSTLYGYIKTRAGSRFTMLFTDPRYVTSINMAKWETYLACLADLAVFLAARVGARAHAGEAELRALALHLVETALRHEEIPAERPQGFDDALAAFRGRVPGVDWRASAAGEAAFGSSLDTLVKWAPIADELKQYDVEIVQNSMRFKWKRVREDFHALLDADAVLADWRARS